MQNERSKKPELTAAAKDLQQQHREQYDISREPLLGGLTSDFDLKLFRDAQMLACEQLVCLLALFARYTHSISWLFLGKPQLAHLPSYTITSQDFEVPFLRQLQSACLMPCQLQACHLDVEHITHVCTSI